MWWQSKIDKRQEQERNFSTNEIDIHEENFKENAVKQKKITPLFIYD